MCAKTIFEQFTKLGRRQFYDINSPVLAFNDFLTESQQTPTNVTESVITKNSQIINDDDGKPALGATRQQVFAQASAPLRDYKAGDLWFDTDDGNHIYRANDALDWVSTRDGSIAGKITTFRQAGIPTSLSAGDVWYDSDDADKMYRAAAAGATTIGVGAWERVDPAWANVQDPASTKPDNNATVGAVFGTNITGGGSANTQISNAGYASLFRQDKFSDGNDGDVTIFVDTTLSADMFYNNLTVNTGITLTTGGFRIFVKGTLTTTGTGKIVRNGNAGSNGTNASAWDTAGSGGAGGAALADGSVKGSIAGIAGRNGVTGVQAASGNTNGGNGTAGNAGTDVAKSLVPSDGAAGKAGGKGGTTSLPGGTTGGTGGVAGIAGVKTGTVYNTIRNAYAAYLLYDFLPSGDNLKAAPANGGGGSGASAGASATAGNAARSGASGGAGGGGNNGGIVVIFAKTITNNGTISANGGAGGNAGTTWDSECPAVASNAAGGSGGSAGGDGGNGGVLIIVYETLTNNGTIQAAGGAGGTKAVKGVKCAFGTGASTDGTDGEDGAAGNAGSVISINV